MGSEQSLFPAANGTVTPPFAPLAIVGMECRLPGAANVAAYEKLLFEGRVGFGPVPADRFDRSLYLDQRKGLPGMSYTELGGCVPDVADDFASLGLTEEQASLLDPVHLNFCVVATRAWESAGLKRGDSRWSRTGVYVGHSGATRFGGDLNLASQIEENLDFLNDVPAFRKLPRDPRRRCVRQIAARIRARRPWRSASHVPRYNGYTAASLPSMILGFTGPRIICDAACASSLFAMQQAAFAIQQGRIDAAIVGGATTNGVDNLILFSQSRACSDAGSCPFDQNASGLISSEGYAAVVVMPLATAQRQKLPILGVITGLGTSSDGKGKSLWAPRVEGQQLAIRRAYANQKPLQIDYLEAHATSTQLGDATELHAVHGLLSQAGSAKATMLIGSAKSNLGHTLETAGVAGLIKILLSMKRRELPPSLGFKKPNAEFDWSAKTIQVVDRKQPWKKTGQAARSAVSAFGIGGLNAHLAVQDFLDRSSVEDAPKFPYQKARIAVVGRGVVLPGALQLKAFADLLKSGKSAIGPAPAERWRLGTGISTDESPRPYHSPTNHGGFIRGYEFDSEPYRIPPLQVKHANPLQMMLLDAVSQAIRELDGGQWKLDRQRAGVVIGTVFGGDFGSQLQLGLRLPEIARELIDVLTALGIDAEQAQQIAQDYRRVVLEQRPALLDETGGFTASTLASRVAKVFDLMGGACAVDADDASGLAGLNLATDQLRSGLWDVAICGAADRTMDLMKFEQLSVQGRLVRSGRVEEVPDDCSRILPGEGVVVLLLKRLDDAVRDGNTVYGIVDEIQQSVCPDAAPAVDDAALVRQIGSLSGAQSLVRIVKQSLLWSDGQHAHLAPTMPESINIESRTEDGLKYSLRFSSPTEIRIPEVRSSKIAETATTVVSSLRSQKPDDASRRTPLIHGQNQPLAAVPTSIRAASSVASDSASPAKVFRFSATSVADLLAELDAVAARIDSAFLKTTAAFDASRPCRVGVLAESPQQLANRLRSVIKQLHTGRRIGVLETDRAVIWISPSSTARTAWVFPGQGAQYEGAPGALLPDSGMSLRLKEFDAELCRQRLEPLTPEFSSTQSRLTDVWWNQAWVLGLSLSLTAELQHRFGRPDVVLGHSFGEYSALVAAGTITMGQAIRMVKSRADAITMTVREPGVLISVRGAPSQVAAVVRDAQIPVEITHFNAPQQTVVASTVEDLESVRQQLTAAGLASVVVPVPVAYHTPRLAQAEELLARSFSTERFLPARFPILSATSARYLIEPADLRESLISQMTRPVLYVQAIERLIADDTTVLIEVGPNNVLSRLNQEIAGTRALCLSLDVPGRSHVERMQLLDLVHQITSGSAASSEIPMPQVRTSARPTQSHQHSETLATPEVEIVDLRKQGTRTRDAIEVGSPVEMPVATVRPVVVPPSKPVAAVPIAAVPVASSGLPSLEEILQFLKTVVVDLTGYAPHVVDFQAELEADLGVDSIKKAQVVGEMAEQFGLDVAPSGVKLSDLTTLEDIAKLGYSQLLEGGTYSSVESVSNVLSESNSDDVSEPAGAMPFDSASIERFLIDLVVDQTGYSRSVVDLDADLEGDLGIDSIKRAQLFGEVQQQFEIQTVSAERTALGRYNTLRSILDFLIAELSVETAAPIQDQQVVKKKPADSLTEPTLPFPDKKTAKKSSPKFFAASADLVNKTVRGFPLVDVPPQEWQEIFLRDESESSSWESGRIRGEQFRAQVRAALQLIQDQNGTATQNVVLTADLEEDLAGLAAGAGVNMGAVRAAYGWISSRRELAPVVLPLRQRSDAGDDSTSPVPSSDLSDHVPASGRESKRFAMRIVPAPQREKMPKVPVLTGPGLIVGNNAYTEQLVQRFRQAGLSCHVVPETASLSELDRALDKIWATSITPHLFITTSHDEGALQDLNAFDWQSRRYHALEVPYRVCQRWMQRTIDEDRMDGASAVILTRLGGDFGFSGRTTESPEGGLAGLIKAMLIECWMRGYRATPMKVVDLSPETTPEEAVDGMFAELAVPSYDMEVAYHRRERWTVQPIHMPLFSDQALHPAPSNGHALIRRGGVWVVTGGARGITSHVVRELARRHNLKLHLIGTAPVPDLTDDVRHAATHDRLQLRREVMRQANLRDQNGMEAWRNVEKSIEIDATLQAMRDDGITAVYHSCDVSRLDELTATLQQIRERDGRIDGVIHGAGIGQDARFDRKRPDKVDQCLRAKIDGCLNLMDATRDDRLDWFVCFGSISGRFGANGHTDYSLANDSLAKLVGKYRQERPEVRSVTFHWHAWGDIGMATKPETKLALEMINMEFMPAKEGLAHFLHELEHGGSEPEVLITDLAYVRKFYPVDRLVSGDAATTRELSTLPLLDPKQQELPTAGPVAVLMDPVQERFLNQHLVQQKPTLPFVIALELMCEGARRLRPDQSVTEIRNLSAIQAIKFSSEEPLEVRVHSESGERDQIRCWLTADVKRRDGRLVARDKMYFEGEFALQNELPQRQTKRPDLSHLSWEPVTYLPPEAAVYHGPDLQCLQRFAMSGKEAFGLISAASTVQLGGGHRPCYGWSTAPAVMDACLYAAALFAGRLYHRPSLPVAFERIQLGRLADPGETPIIHVRLDEELESGLRLNFQLIGLNGDLLLDVQGYRIGWLE